jgi:hypothetical protein
LKIFKTHKNSYMRLLCIANPEYGGGGGSRPRITEFRSVFAQTFDFLQHRSLTPMDFERKFKTHKNSYT